jgi:hypothetical protein
MGVRWSLEYIDKGSSYKLEPIYDIIDAFPIFHLL